MEREVEQRLRRLVERSITECDVLAEAVEIRADTETMPELALVVRRLRTLRDELSSELHAASGPDPETVGLLARLGRRSLVLAGEGVVQGAAFAATQALLARVSGNLSELFEFVVSIAPEASTWGGGARWSAASTSEPVEVSGAATTEPVEAAGEAASPPADGWQRLADADGAVLADGDGSPLLVRADPNGA